VCQVVQQEPEDNGTPIAGEPATVEGNPDVDDIAPV
jgi:hypothetical protein